MLSQFTTEVVSCVEATLNTTIEGKKTNVDGFEVILRDTILFPEGGGQVKPQSILLLFHKQLFQIHSHQIVDS